MSKKKIIVSKVPVKYTRVYPYLFKSSDGKFVGHVHYLNVNGSGKLYIDERCDLRPISYCSLEFIKDPASFTLWKEVTAKNKEIFCIDMNPSDSQLQRQETRDRRQLRSITKIYYNSKFTQAIPKHHIPMTLDLLKPEHGKWFLEPRHLLLDDANNLYLDNLHSLSSTEEEDFKYAIIWKEKTNNQIALDIRPLQNKYAIRRFFREKLHKSYYTQITNIICNP